jgi:hypothetical protein
MYSNVQPTEYCTEFYRVTKAGDGNVIHNENGSPLSIRGRGILMTTIPNELGLQNYSIDRDLSIDFYG